MDLIEKEFNYRGHDCVITFTEIGYRCGYVCIDKDEAFYDKRFTEINDSKELITQLSYAGTIFPKNDGRYWIAFTCDEKGSKPDLDKVREVWGERPMLLTYLNMQKISPIPTKGVIHSTEYVEFKLEKLVDEVIAYENRRQTSRT